MQSITKSSAVAPPKSLILSHDASKDAESYPVDDTYQLKVPINSQNDEMFNSGFKREYQRPVPIAATPEGRRAAVAALEAEGPEPDYFELPPLPQLNAREA